MHTVISAFDDRQQAERAVERLVERGFERDQVHHEAGRDAGMASGTRTATHTAAADDDGFLHRVAEFFRDLFGDTDHAESGRYAEAVRRGGYVVVLDARSEDDAERARAALEDLGGSMDLDERETQWRSEGWSGYAPADAGSDRSLGRTTATEGTGGASGVQGGQREAVMPVLQEEVQIGKRQVSRGGVRVVQRVTETPVKEMVRLREERAVVERRPVDRPAGEADFENFREGTIEVRETVEEPVVSKTARVVEEVVVGKQVEERTEAVSESVRRTDVEVEPLGAGEQEATRTRIRGATEDAAEASGNILERAGRKVAHVARDVKDDLKGRDR